MSVVTKENYTINHTLYLCTQKKLMKHLSSATLLSQCRVQHHGY